MRVALTRATAASLALYMLLGQRLTIDASTGGRGALSLPEALFLGLSILLWITLKIRTDGPRAKGIGIISVGPLFALLILLPVIGVFIGDYEIRALYSFIVVLIPTSIMILGTAGARWGVDIRKPAFYAIVGHGLYGLGQLLSRVGAMPTSLWGWAVSWDAQTQATYSEAYVISSRSTGLFVNPNEFGLWSVLAVTFGAVYLRDRQRVVSVILGSIGVFASQSRTAWLAFALLAVWGFVAMFRRPETAKAGLIGTAVAGSVIAMMAAFGLFGRLIESGAVSRFNTGFGALSGGGASEDANLSGRIVGWDRAIEFIQNYAFGTLGPPQLKFGGSIDNQFVSYYLQGGLLLVAAYLLMLTSPFFLHRNGILQSWQLMIVAITFAVSSYTSNPMDSPIATSLAWVCAILCIQASLRTKAEQTGPLGQILVHTEKDTEVDVDNLSKKDN